MFKDIRAERPNIESRDRVMAVNERSANVSVAKKYGVKRSIKEMDQPDAIFIWSYDNRSHHGIYDVMNQIKKTKVLMSNKRFNKHTLVESHNQAINRMVIDENEIYFVIECVDNSLARLIHQLLKLDN